ncbi:MAG: hypothetical protein JSV84_13220, partial [Gemmatimonadota bacterium]
MRRFKISCTITPVFIAAVSFLFIFQNTLSAKNEWCQAQSKSNGDIVLQFQIPENVKGQAEYFRIARATDAEQAGVHVADIPSHLNNYRDDRVSLDDDTPYYYTIQLIDYSGKIIPGTEFKITAVADGIPPDPVTWIACNALPNGSIELLWQAVEDTTGPGETVVLNDITNYEIVRRERQNAQVTMTDTIAFTRVDSSLSKCVTKKKGDRWRTYCYTLDGADCAEDCATLRYIDEWEYLNWNYTYRYIVIPIDHAGNRREEGNDSTGFCHTDNNYQAVPVDPLPTCTRGLSRMLQWQPVEEAVGYEIQWNKEPYGTGVFDTSVTVNVALNDQTVDHSSGGIYCYRIRSIYKNDRKSTLFSDTVCSNQDHTPPRYDVSGLEISKPCSSYDRSADICLTWTYPEGECTTDDSCGVCWFRIVRWVGTDTVDTIIVRDCEKDLFSYCDRFAIRFDNDFCTEYNYRVDPVDCVGNSRETGKIVPIVQTWTRKLCAPVPRFVSESAPVCTVDWGGTNGKDFIYYIECARAKSFSPGSKCDSLLTDESQWVHDLLSLYMARCIPARDTLYYRLKQTKVQCPDVWSCWSNIDSLFVDFETTMCTVKNVRTLARAGCSISLCWEEPQAGECYFPDSIAIERAEHGSELWLDLKPVLGPIPFTGNTELCVVDTSYRLPMGHPLRLENGTYYDYRVSLVDRFGRGEWVRADAPAACDCTTPAKPEILLCNSAADSVCWSCADDSCWANGIVEPFCGFWKCRNDTCWHRGDTNTVCRCPDTLESSDSFRVAWSRSDRWLPSMTWTSLWYEDRCVTVPDQPDQPPLSGEKYYYTIQVKDSVGNESAWSDTVCCWQDPIPPPSVDLRVEIIDGVFSEFFPFVQNEGNRVDCVSFFTKLEWNLDGILRPNDVKGYFILKDGVVVDTLHYAWYRSWVDSSSKVVVACDGGPQTMPDDTGDLCDYTYAVLTFDFAGNTSNDKQNVSIVCDTLNPFIASGHARPCSLVSDIYVPASAPLVLSWESMQEVDEYVVEYSTRDYPVFEFYVDRIDTVSCVDGTCSSRPLDLSDRTVFGDNKKWFFRVRGIGSDGSHSLPSAPRSFRVDRKRPTLRPDEPIYNVVNGCQIHVSFDDPSDYDTGENCGLGSGTDFYELYRIMNSDTTLVDTLFNDLEPIEDCCFDSIGLASPVLLTDDLSDIPFETGEPITYLVVIGDKVGNIFERDTTLTHIECIQRTDTLSFSPDCWHMISVPIKGTMLECPSDVFLT